MAIDLTVATWIWGKKYNGQYIARLKRGLQRGLKQPHRFVLFEPWPGDEALFAGCFVRLRMFNPSFQRYWGIAAGVRVVCVDLDVIITGELDPLFDRPESFCILTGANAANPCPYNGSLIMFRAGAHWDLWQDFSLEEAAKIPKYEFPDDQGWIAARLPNAAGWKAGSASGVYAFKKPGWPKGDALPGDARMVCFPGARDPSQFTHLSWVKEYWR